MEKGELSQGLRAEVVEDQSCRHEEWKERER